MAPEPGATPVAVVTGGAGGVGLACARLLGARGGPVLIADLAGPRLDAAEAELRAAGVDATALDCDVTAAADVERLARAAAERGPLRALAHTAGISPPGPFTARDVWDVCYAGTCHVLAAFEPLATAGSAAICIASIGAHRTPLAAYDEVLAGGDPDAVWGTLAGSTPIEERPHVAYVLAKRGVMVLVEQRAHAWGARGARIASVSPGNVDTQMGRAAVAVGADALVRASSPGRPADAAEIAAAVAFLASDAASYVHGCDLRVDGGTIANFNHHPDPPEARDRWNVLW